MNALINYLIDNLILDFQGDLSMDEIRDFLRDDKSRDAERLRGKLVEDRTTSQMMLTLADCLKEHLRTGINEDVIREQLRMYTES
ncbi:MAG TPA: hypothetical protein PKI49_06065 [Pseudomonadota bacterium]|nr:hypothetical protein [Pseudomonadota bacterium]HNI61009.1 hypothetical protein [Pseudomonadota bacterium]HNK45966.1 hypothetical protein [Pseudomonadota bacterium]HNN52300.1 hypothetical protein [Pseudomonadota bacterium]HNO68056.1 hypothetical protein [Pseudomonadota bacterium]